MKFILLLLAVPLLGVFPINVSADQTDLSPSFTTEMIRARQVGVETANTAIQQIKQLTGEKKFSSENGVLIAQGDSWFDYPFYNVLTYLKWHHSFRIESAASNGKWLETMAYDPDQLSAFGEVLKRVADEGKKPRAILLSGGGNDIAGPQLTMLLNHRRSKTPPLDDKMASELFENRLQLDMLTLISAVSELCHRYFPKEPVIPIFIHGYDHPVPDGRGYLGGFWFLPGPWLKPAFDTKGYQDNNNDLQLATNVMGELIDKYNKVLLGIPNLPGMSYVHYVHIFGSLSNDLTKYKDDWGNELHPTRSGFERVADIFAKEIDKASKK